jgi:hypothetical protein
MHHKLRELNGIEGAAPELPGQVRRVKRRGAEQFPFQAHPGVAEAFAEEIERAMEGGVLRYSRRAALLRRAKGLGIGRFEANLLIATVLHKCGNVVATTDARDDGGGWGGVVLVVATVQAAIVGAVWWLLAA